MHPVVTPKYLDTRLWYLSVLYDIVKIILLSIIFAKGQFDKAKMSHKHCTMKISIEYKIVSA